MNPNVIASSPTPGSIDVAINSQIYVRFDTDMMESTLTDLTCLLMLVNNPLTNPTYIPVDRTITYDESNRTVAIVPNGYLNLDSTYRVIIVGDPSNDGINSGVMSITGDVMYNNYVFDFETEAISSVDDDDDDSGSGSSSSSSTVTGPLKVIQTDPSNNQMYVSDTGVYIAFNNPLVLNTGVYDVFRNYIETEEDYLKSKLTIYRSNILGTSSQVYDTPTYSVDYTYIIDNEVLKLDISESNTQLPNNTRYIVNILPGMSGVTTTAMESSYQFTFLTPLLPMYTTPELIRLQHGEFLNDFTDEWISLIIHKYSIEIYNLYGEADVSLPYDPNESPTVPEIVKRYVYCKTKWDLINQVIQKAINSGIGGSIRLGDFAYTSGNIIELLKPVLDELEECIKGSSKIIQSTLYSNQIAMVPHYYDTRAPWYDRNGYFSRTTLKGDIDDD